MSTLRQQQRSGDTLAKVYKCNGCGTKMTEENFDPKKNGELYKTCITCRADYKTKQEKEKKKKEKELKLDKEIKEGMSFCKKCKQTLLLSSFDTKKNGSYYVDCRKCRAPKH